LITNLNYEGLAVFLGARDVWQDGRWSQPFQVFDYGRLLTDFELGHLPGAQHVEKNLVWTEVEGVQGMLPAMAALAQALEGQGFDPARPALVYDAGNGLYAARLAWALSVAGWQSVALLEGGLATWKSAGLPVNQGSGDSPKPTKLTLPRERKWYATLADVQGKASATVLLDTRSEAEFLGTDRRAKRAGRIPNSVWWEWSRSLEDDGLTLRSPTSIAQELATLGINPETEVITYCQSGVRAAHALLSLQRAGVTNVRNYDGSWEEWGNRDDTPLEAGIPSTKLKDTRTFGAFVSTDWLAAHLSDPRLVLIDVRSPEEYSQGHIPGAINIPRNQYYSTRTQPDGKVIKYSLPQPEHFAELLTSAGIRPSSWVVAYDYDTSSYAGRFPWMLRSLGHESAWIIDGGIDKWKDVDGRALETVPRLPVRALASYPPAAFARLLATKDQLLQVLDSPGEVTIADIRTKEEYEGTTLLDPSFGARAGHIPRAILVEYDSLYTDFRDSSGRVVPSSFQEGRPVQVLKNPEQLLALLESKGLTRNQTVYAYCEGGFRAAVYTLILDALAYDKPLNYEGSWNEWSKQDDFPVSRIGVE